MNTALHDAEYASICMNWKYKKPSAKNDDHIMFVTNDKLMNGWGTIKKSDFDKVKDIYPLYTIKRKGEFGIGVSLSFSDDTTHVNKTTGVVFKIENNKVYAKPITVDDARCGVSGMAWVKFCSLEDFDTSSLMRVANSPVLPVQKMNMSISMTPRKSIEVIDGTPILSSKDKDNLIERLNGDIIKQKKSVISTNTFDLKEHWKEVIKSTLK